VGHRGILAECAAPDGVAAVTAAGSLSYTKYQLTDTVMAVTTLYRRRWRRPRLIGPDLEGIGSPRWLLKRISCTPSKASHIATLKTKGLFDG
jgi:hypothetical protein